MNEGEGEKELRHETMVITEGTVMLDAFTTPRPFTIIYIT